MALTVRTADKVVQSVIRKIPGGIGTSPPAVLTDPTLAHGQSGSDDCVLTVAIRNAVVGTTGITLWIFATAMGEWVTAGASSSINTKTFNNGSMDVFVLGEQTKYFLQATQVLTDGQIWVDGTNPGGGIQTGENI